MMLKDSLVIYEFFGGSRDPDVDDASYTEHLDLASVSTRSELAEFLRIVHLRADKPSFRSLEARTRHDLTPLSKTVVSEMLRGVRFPRKAIMVSFLRACGVPDDHVALWSRAWERIAAPYAGSPRQDSPDDAIADSASAERLPDIVDSQIELLRDRIDNLMRITSDSACNWPPSTGSEPYKSRAPSSRRTRGQRTAR
jgi:hypothetical protein